ncbi:MAG: heavy metal translocating P-type ATPase, partial [Clostridia bacterium]|nr:heavy metal translocating P-type ATPase [Clostridia bacterium]
MKEITKNFSVYGMSCAACSARVERAVKNTEGVKSVAVSLLTNEMRVTFLPPATEKSIIDSVVKAGYSAAVQADKKSKNAPIGRLSGEMRVLIWRLVSSVALLVVLMYFSMGHMIGLPLPPYLSSVRGAYLLAVIEAALSLAVLIINGRFFISGVKSLIHLSPNMDALVALGSGTSFIYSLVLTIEMIVFTYNGDYPDLHMVSGDLYFEGAAMIVTLITVGKTLESYSKGRTTDAINALMALAPETATILVDGEERVVMIEEVKIGDIIVVKTGDYIPVDAEIVSGAGSIDQSAMTGESIPSDKTVGDFVFCGTVNVNGYFTARAVKVGEDTSLNKIVELVKNVNLSKAPIAKIADKISAIFVPVVIGIALITFGVWMIVGAEFSFALRSAVAVLLISCPCALGLATPVAIMVGSGVGAKCGALFKS